MKTSPFNVIITTLIAPLILNAQDYSKIKYIGSEDDSFASSISSEKMPDGTIKNYTPDKKEIDRRFRAFLEANGRFVQYKIDAIENGKGFWSKTQKKETISSVQTHASRTIVCRLANNFEDDSRVYQTISSNVFIQCSNTEKLAKKEWFYGYEKEFRDSNKTIRNGYQSYQIIIPPDIDSHWRDTWHYADDRWTAENGNTWSINDSKTNNINRKK